MKVFTLAILLVSLCCSAFADEIDISKAPSNVQQYSPFVIKLKLPYFPGNVNDPQNVSVEAQVTSPSGKNIVMPLFCESNERKEKKSFWQLWFSPVETGKYEYSVRVTAESLQAESASASFLSEPGAAPGFLRKTRDNDYYLEFNSGEPFFGIGHDIGWVHNSSPQVFERYFALLSESGCNLTRIWMSSWALPIEWNKIGEYNKISSEKLDEVLKVASERGIYIILCLDTYGSLMSEGGMWGEEDWGANPYNIENGGPCKNPEDFFINPLAKAAYKNRLRYIVSRWGYSPNILAFELWNEYNAPQGWVKEIASYIKSIDPHGHFLTTSMGYPYGTLFDESEIWKLEDVDLVTFHEYGDGAEHDIVLPLIQESRKVTLLYKKPFIASEFGIDFAKDDKVYDPQGEGTALHNSLWASSLSKSFGSAMNWWYDTYVRPKNLYPHYRALANFLSGVDWKSGRIEYIEIGSVMQTPQKGVKPTYRDVSFLPEDKWGKIEITEFTVQNNGDLSGAGMPTKYLHGTAKKGMKADHAFNVDYPKDGEFILHIGTVSQGGDLHVFLDGQEIARKEFPVGDGKGPWKRSLYLKKYKVFQCVYEEDFIVKVPRGEHAIRLSNTGVDWIGIEKITLTDYVDNTRANARCLGLLVGDEMLFWVQNKSSNWQNTFNKVDPEPLKNTYFEVPDVDDGNYEVEWWDTYMGTILSSEKTSTEEGKLRIYVPVFFKDIACKITKRGKD